MILFCLLQVTKTMEHSSQSIVTMCHIDMFRSQLFQTNGKGTIMTLFCLLQLTKIKEYRTQIIVVSCHFEMFRSELF